MGQDRNSTNKLHMHSIQGWNALSPDKRLEKKKKGKEKEGGKNPPSSRELPRPSP